MRGAAVPARQDGHRAASRPPTSPAPPGPLPLFGGSAVLLKIFPFLPELLG